jgi:hypothetical protein
MDADHSGDNVNEPTERGTHHRGITIAATSCQCPASNIEHPWPWGMAKTNAAATNIPRVESSGIILPPGLRCIGRIEHQCTNRSKVV